MRLVPIFVASTILLLTVAAPAQESRSEISLQGTGFFAKDSTGNGIMQRTTDSGGFLVGYRYHINRWLSAEGVYGYDRNSQKYSVSSGAYRIQSNIHQATGGLVANLPFLARSKFNPYVLAEGGAMVFAPIGNPFATLAGSQTQARGVFVYGAGVNYPILKHISLRLEYRGLVYHAPDFGLSGLQTNSITHTAQPSMGIVFRF
jgi:opacity protein-like surface antigen